MLEKINFALCSFILPIVLCGVGIFFMIKLRLFYIFHPIKTLRTIVGSSGGFAPLCVALAGTLGVGNIVGVASAIIMGGAGAIFWMLLSAFVAMSVKYAEAYLGVKHRRGCVDNYYGGAPYYIHDACGGGKAGVFLGGAFAILCVINSLSTGNLVQINSISDLMTDNRLAFGLLMASAVFIIVIGGRRRIESVSSVIIPLLTVLYMLISFYIIFSNFEALCVVISRIFKEAFSIKSAMGGAFGFGIGSAIRYGVSRGLLSNEAGCGTAPTAHALSSLSPHSQGCLGIFEVFWDTVVLCLITALVILIADTGSQNPIALVMDSYGKFTGTFGRAFICCSCILFALATVACQYFYGEMSLKFLSRGRFAKHIYSIIFFAICILSSIISSRTMWLVSDFIIAILALYNLAFLILLSKEIN